MGGRMIVVEISYDMRLLASMLGGIRTLMNRGGQVVDGKIGPQDGMTADQDAIIGELAFAKAHNVWPDLSLKPRSGSADLLIGGKRIDIKSTRHPNGRLLGKRKVNEDVDVYVLAIISDHQVTFPGWAHRHELYDDNNLINLGHGFSYGLTQDQLNPWEAA